MIEPLKPAQLEELHIPHEDTAPVFAAPWEASAFAMVLALHKAGRFKWREWVDLLAQEIGASPPDPTGALYYERWARALERLLDRLELMTPAVIDARTRDWRAAYLATPHGDEVLLSNAKH